MKRLLPGADRPFTGRHMLAVVGLFFGTVIAVNAVMATAAVRTFPGLNARNGYVASQTYNLLLDDAAAQARRGWRAEVETADGQLRLALRDRAGALLRGLTVTALAGRPANAAADRILLLRPVRDGYEAAEGLAAGRWLLEIEAREGDRLVWRETRPVTVRHKERSS